jgi:hypothetical protein
MQDTTETIYHHGETSEAPVVTVTDIKFISFGSAVVDHGYFAYTERSLLSLLWLKSDPWLENLRVRYMFVRLSVLRIMSKGRFKL